MPPGPYLPKPVSAPAAAAPCLSHTHDGCYMEGETPRFFSTRVIPKLECDLQKIFDEGPVSMGGIEGFSQDRQLHSPCNHTCMHSSCRFGGDQVYQLLVYHIHAKHPSVLKLMHY